MAPPLNKCKIPDKKDSEKGLLKGAYYKNWGVAFWGIILKKN